MRRYLVLFGAALAVAAASYVLTRGFWRAGETEEQSAWLRREFHLTPAQAAAIEKIQSDYGPVCAEHCRLIRKAQERLAAAPSDPTAAAEVRRLERFCSTATLAHLRGIAALMSPEDGRRFLALVEPKVSRHEHAGPLGLR